MNLWPTLLLAVALPLQAQNWRMEASDGKTTILITDKRGVCVAPAYEAWWKPQQGDPVRGCWRAHPQQPGGVHIVWFDGDTTALSITVFREPEPK